jgi:hypothetical protein
VILLASHMCSGYRNPRRSATLAVVGESMGSHDMREEG